MIMKTKLFLTGLAIIAITTISFGQNSGTTNQPASSGKGVAFVDENKDGICDNFENRNGKDQSARGRYGNKGGSGYGNGRGNCNGKGPGKGQGQGNGRNFVDKNEDGICDNFKVSKQN